MRLIRIALLVALFPVVVQAQRWAVTFAGGPFIFGDFAESESRLRPFIVPLQTDSVTHSLSAKTRAGAAAGLERYFNQRLSARLEATFTESVLAVKSGSDDDSVTLDIGDLSVTTIAVPLVFRLNRGGAIRPLIYAGPAYVIYDVNPQMLTGTVPIFSGSRGRLGGIGGAGLEWWWSNRFAVRATASDIVTESPLKRSDFPGPVPSSLEIKTAHNIHGTVGIAYRF